MSRPARRETVDIEVAVSQAGVDETVVSLAAAGGTADAADWNATAGSTFVVAAGETAGTLSLEIVDDGEQEGLETLVLELDSATFQYMEATSP